MSPGAAEIFAAHYHAAIGHGQEDDHDDDQDLDEFSRTRKLYSDEFSSNSEFSVDLTQPSSADADPDDELSPCPHCQRTFLPERLEVHLRSCGRGHVAKPLSPRQSKSAGRLGLASRLGAAVSAPRQPSPPLLTCHLCGKQMLGESLALHKVMCTERHERERGRWGEKICQRAAPPSADGAEEGAFDAASLSPCPHCSRTFLPDRLEVHLRPCRQAALRAVMARREEAAAARAERRLSCTSSSSPKANLALSSPRPSTGGTRSSPSLSPSRPSLSPSAALSRSPSSAARTLMTSPPLATAPPIAARSSTIPSPSPSSPGSFASATGSAPSSPLPHHPRSMPRSPPCPAPAPEPSPAPLCHPCLPAGSAPAPAASPLGSPSLPPAAAPAPSPEPLGPASPSAASPPPPASAAASPDSQESAARFRRAKGAEVRWGPREEGSPSQPGAGPSAASAAAPTSAAAASPSRIPLSKHSASPPAIMGVSISAPAEPKRGARERLLELQELLECALVTEAEFSAKRLEILAEL